MAIKIREDKLMNARHCIDEVFREEDRPCEATWVDWRDKGYIPCVKIGRRVWYDPAECHAALKKRFWKQNNYSGLGGS